MRLHELPQELQSKLAFEFCIGGSCGCDGAIDDGCPWCTESKLNDWMFQQILQSHTIRPDPLKGIQNSYFPVLDHGFISLVDTMGTDASIAEAARVSYGAGNRSLREDRTLIRYLYNHKHTSPFEMVELKFHCKMPIFVARQWIRHRTASVNEVSGRYSIMPLQMYLPEPEVVRAQSQTNKQGREEELSASDVIEFLDNCVAHRIGTKTNYTNALKSNVARELSRIDLPLSLYTEWYWKIDLHNLLHFLTLRCDSHAQEEIRQYASLMASIVKYILPISFEAWIDYRFGAVQLSRLDQVLLAEQMKTGVVPSKERAIAIGMTGREWSEYVQKTAFEANSLPTFDLNLDSARTADFFLEQAKAFVPSI